MKLLLSIIIIGVVAVIGSRISFYKRKLPLGFLTIILTGTEYIFLGLILGQSGLNIIDKATYFQLKPILIFVLCMIGFLFGLIFDVKQMKKLPSFYFSITSIQALITFILVSSISYLFLNFIFSFKNYNTLIMSMVLGSAACCTAQSALAIVARSKKFSNKNVLELLRYISGVDGLFGMIFFSLAMFMAYIGETTGSFLLIGFQWFVSLIALSVLPALLLIGFSWMKFTQQEFTLFIIGSLMVCAGLAQTFHYPVLIAGLICGFVVANFGRHRMRTFSFIVQSEKSVYIFLLLLIGASWDIRLNHYFVFIVFYFLIRLLGKIIGSFTATRIFRSEYKVPSLLGFGLISDGGLTIALIMCFQILHPNSGSVLLLTPVIFSVLVSELIGPFSILKVLKESK